MQFPDPSHRTSWPPPNYSNPETRRIENLIITCALLPVALFVVVWRLVSRLKYFGYWGIEDTLMVASLFPTTAYALLSLFFDFTTGWRHIWDYPVAKIVLGRQVDMASQMLFVVAGTIIQISILMFIRRLLLNSEVLMNNLILIMILVVTIQAPVFIFLELFQCRYVPDYWILSVQTQPCIKESRLLLAAGISQTVTTLTTFFFCLMRYRQVPVVPFITGVTMFLAGAFRTYYLFHATASSDQFWHSYPAWVAGSIELYAGIICASSLPPQQHVTRKATSIRRLEMVVEDVVKDEPVYRNKPTAIGETYCEQLPGLYLSPITSYSTEIDSNFISPPLTTYDHTREGTLNYCLSSLSGNSSMLPPIIEESILSNKPAPFIKTPRPLISDFSSDYSSSDCSSISSFNVANLARETPHPISITFKRGHLTRTQYYTQNPSDQFQILASMHESGRNRAYSYKEAETAIGHDENCNLRVRGERNGYLTCPQITQDMITRT